MSTPQQEASGGRWMFQARKRPKFKGKNRRESDINSASKVKSHTLILSNCDKSFMPCSTLHPTIFAQAFPRPPLRILLPSIALKSRNRDKSYVHSLVEESRISSQTAVGANMTREDSSPTTPTGATPTPSTQPDGFDIVNTYSHLLLTDPDLTMPVAAIESLITLLSTTPLTTISETLSLLSSASTTLKNSVPNPISLSAGTDLFQRYLITQLQAHRNAIGRAGGADPAGDFRAIRNHLLTNGRLFVQRAKASREKIARFGRGFIRDGTTVLTNGGSRVVGALLKAAATSSGSAHSTPGSGPGGPRFRVIYVAPDLPSLSDPSSNSTLTPGHTRLSLDPTISTLRALHVPVAVIPFSAIASTLPMISMVIVGAEGVVENGGIINRLGTYQLGLLAKSAGKPFYVVAESHKFVRMYPLGQGDLGLQQRVVEFMTGVEEEGKGLEVVRDEGGVKKVATANGETMAEKDVKPEARLEEAVDFTPPDLISALITEGGVLTPSAVSEELIKIWF